MLCCGLFVLPIVALTINTKMFLWTIRFLFTDACVLTCLSKQDFMLNNECIIKAAESITTQYFKFLISIQETIHIITVVLAAMGHLHGTLPYLIESNALGIEPC